MPGSSRAVLKPSKNWRSWSQALCRRGHGSRGLDGFGNLSKYTWTHFTCRCEYLPSAYPHFYWQISCLQARICEYSQLKLKMLNYKIWSFQIECHYMCMLKPWRMAVKHKLYIHNTSLCVGLEFESYPVLILTSHSPCDTVLSTHPAC